LVRNHSTASYGANSTAPVSVPAAVAQIMAKQAAARDDGNGRGRPKRKSDDGSSIMHTPTKNAAVEDNGADANSAKKNGQQNGNGNGKRGSGSMK
jgi:hypothetical protein